jgi:hypothetical protein
MLFPHKPGHGTAEERISLPTVISFRGAQPFLDKGLRPLLWGGGGSRAARVRIIISGIPSRLNYCVMFEIYIRVCIHTYNIYRCVRGPHNTTRLAAS